MKWIVLALILISCLCSESNAQGLYDVKEHGDSMTMHKKMYSGMRTWSVKAKQQIQYQDSAIVALQSTVSDLSNRLVLRDTLLLQKNETIERLNNAIKNCNPKINILKRPEPYIMALVGILTYAVATGKR